MFSSSSSSCRGAGGPVHRSGCSACDQCGQKRSLSQSHWHPACASGPVLLNFLQQNPDASVEICRLGSVDSPPTPHLNDLIEAFALYPFLCISILLLFSR